MRQHARGLGLVAGLVGLGGIAIVLLGAVSASAQGVAERVLVAQEEDDEALPPVESGSGEGLDIGDDKGEEAAPPPPSKPAPVALPEEREEKPKKEEKPKDREKEPEKESGKGSIGSGGQVELREDRIKSIQRKSFLKKGRWELTPLAFLSLNDPFYQKVGVGAGAAVHFAEGLGLEIEGTYLGTVQTDMVGFFQRANRALPKVSRLRFYGLTNLMWSPLYGKVSWFTDEIASFDFYLMGGFGVGSSETGMKLVSNLGCGIRYFLNSWLVLKVEARDLLYNETMRLDMERQDFTDIQSHFFLGVGVSFFLPSEFTYEYQ